MVVFGHRPQPRSPQRRDGDGQGVVGVVLLRLARTEQPHPRRQRRRHVHDVLPDGEELLGEEVTEPAGRLDGPQPLGIVDGPLEQPLDLQAVGPKRQLPELVLRVVDGHRRVGGLVRIDADEHHRDPSFRSWKATTGKPDVVECSPLSSHAVAEEPGGWHFGVKSQPEGGRHFKSQSAGILETLGPRLSAHRNYESGTSRMGWQSVLYPG